MPDDFITLKAALTLTTGRYTEVSQLRRAAERWAAGDHKTGLQAVLLSPRLWATKRSWVERWLRTYRPARGRPPGRKDNTPRKPRGTARTRPLMEQQP